MKLNKLFALGALAGAALLVAAPASANKIVDVDFEGAASFASIADFYASQGITFGLDALALSNDVLGPYFSGTPTGSTSVMFAAGSDAFMNVADGFTGNLQFWYSSSASLLDSVKVWSGANGTGTLLATVSLFDNATLGCSDSAFCRFDLTSVMFAGTAHSIDFGGNFGQVAFDNVTITAVPEPETFALMFAGLGVMGLLAQRRRRG